MKIIFQLKIFFQIKLTVSDFWKAKSETARDKILLWVIIQPNNFFLKTYLSKDSLQAGIIITYSAAVCV